MIKRLKGSKRRRKCKEGMTEGGVREKLKRFQEGKEGERERCYFPLKFVSDMRKQ